jgi:hypothetical protein
MLSPSPCYRILYLNSNSKYFFHFFTFTQISSNYINLKIIKLKIIFKIKNTLTQNYFKYFENTLTQIQIN